MGYAEVAAILESCTYPRGTGLTVSKAGRDGSCPATDPRRRLFGLSDELVRLPFLVDELVHDSRRSPAQRMAAYEDMLQRIPREYGVELASVVEPLELAKNALRLHETVGALGPAPQQAILERYAGPETTRLYLEHQMEQQDPGRAPAGLQPGARSTPGTIDPRGPHAGATARADARARSTALREIPPAVGPTRTREITARCSRWWR